LICYEDCFPKLARKSVSAGADILFVATNDAWYGEEGAAYFHAAHSVLRAVENRRPVIRSGNAGWSGWIDPYGKIRDLLVNDANSIYFRGGGVMELKSYPKFRSKMSFYTKHGDWFVLLSGACVTLGFGAHWLSKEEESNS
jgi:apolipoprotein N-acyltransferase